MASCLMGFYDQGQGNLLERFQQALRGGMGRRSLGITRVQPRQGSAHGRNLRAISRSESPPLFYPFSSWVVSPYMSVSWDPQHLQIQLHTVR
jgi:hypothetical protein